MATVVYRRAGAKRLEQTRGDWRGTSTSLVAVFYEGDAIRYAISGPEDDALWDSIDVLWDAFIHDGRHDAV